jgi:hypothetical protein
MSILIVQSENKNLQQAAERLEMELLYMRAADVNGGVGSDEDGECEEDAGVYKQRYERTVRELEFTRRRLQQQHEDDLEQLVGLKKQLEKKVLDSPQQSHNNVQVSRGLEKHSRLWYIGLLQMKYINCYFKQNNCSNKLVLVLLRTFSQDYSF